MVTIGKNSVVTLSYEVADTDGTIIDAGEEMLTYLHGCDDIFAVIESVLEGKAPGDTVTVKLQPEQAYGEYDAELVQIADVADLPQPLRVGMQIEGESGDGGAAVFYRVTDIADGKAVLDGNHPLAGMALVFTATVTAVRPATTAEIKAGRVG